MNEAAVASEPERAASTAPASPSAAPEPVLLEAPCPGWAVSGALPCVNRDPGEQAAGPVTSAMPLKRRPAVKMSPVAKCQSRKLAI
jgi:hypothetical protein